MRLKHGLRIVLLLWTLDLLVNAVAPLAAQVSDPCAKVNLPASVLRLVDTQFSGWRPKLVADLDPDNRQLWLNAHPKECPGTIIGHFENRDRLAYAVLLVPTSETTGGYKLVVFNKASIGDNFGWKLLDHADAQTYPGLVVSKALPGKYWNAEHTKSIQTTLDGIYLEWIEKGANLYYWSAGKYRKLQVSE